MGMKGAIYIYPFLSSLIVADQCVWSIGAVETGEARLCLGKLGIFLFHFCVFYFVDSNIWHSNVI